MMFLLFVVASSLACIAVALWGIMFTIKQAYTLLERLVNMLLKTVNRWKV
jgi:hypothetical protein